MSYLDFTLRLLMALAAGVSIGFERQWNHKSAGLRTTTLVSLGAAFYVLISMNITQSTGDPTRIIGQVVTGIGFLCAGVIFREGTSVHGLTTAVTIWCSSAIGSLAAAGYYIETIIATSFILLVNILLKPIDKWLTNRNLNQTQNEK